MCHELHAHASILSILPSPYISIALMFKAAHYEEPSKLGLTVLILSILVLY
jgi:hypothetical protein